MTKIYFKQQDNRKKEIAFFQFLQKNIQQVQHIDENYPISPLLLKNYIDIPKTIKALNNDTKLSPSKRGKTIEALQSLPNKVFVAKNITDVSVDFTIIKNNNIQFIEFHEKQHSQLSVSRPTPIFCSKSERFEIPRFAQRLLKDLWRWQNLPNYKIVWWDWFEDNQNSFKISNLISNNRNEFYNNGKFSFSNFCI
jgi:hypothetical protein